MSTNTDIRTGAELVLTITGVRSGESLHDLVRYFRAVEFGLNLAFEIVDGLSFEPGGGNLPRNMIRVIRVRYGSPIQIAIDLKPLIEFLTDNGYLVFMGLVAKMFADGTSGWKNLTDAAKANHERRLLKLRARADEKASRVEAADRAHRASELAKAKEDEYVKAFVDSLVESAIARHMEDISAKQRAQAKLWAIEYVEMHLDEAAEAAQMLGDKDIEIERE